MTTISGLNLVREILENGLSIFSDNILNTNTIWLDQRKTPITPRTLNLLHGNYGLLAVTHVVANAYVKTGMSIGFVVNSEDDAKRWMKSIMDHIEPGFVESNYVDFTKFVPSNDIGKFLTGQSDRPVLFELRDGKTLAESISVLDSQCDLIFYPYNVVNRDDLASITLERATVIFYERYIVPKENIPTQITNDIGIYTDVISNRNVLVACIEKRFEDVVLSSSVLLADGPETNPPILDFIPYEQSTPSQSNEGQSFVSDGDGLEVDCVDLLDIDEVTMVKMSMMVKLCRTLLKMSQTEFANFMNISLPTVNRIENLEADLSVTELFSVMHNLKSFGINIDLETIGDPDSDISFKIGSFAVQGYAKGTKVYDNAVLRTVKNARYYDLRNNLQQMSIYPTSERSLFSTKDKDIILVDQESLNHLIDEIGIDEELFQRLDVTHRPYVAAIGVNELHQSTMNTNPLAFIGYSKIYFLPDDEFEELSIAIEGQFEDSLEDLDEETIETIKMDNGAVLRHGFDQDYALTLISFVHDLSADGAFTPQDFIDTRKRLKLSIKKFADLLGVSHITAARYETGQSKPVAAVVSKMKELVQR